MNIASVTIHVGDCLESLRKMPGASVHCVVTSPPYFGLRDYKMPGQIGLEKTPEQFVAALVEVFREARRVLRDDGVFFLNLGDSYFGGGGHSPNSPSARSSKSGKYGRNGVLIKGHTSGGARRAAVCGTSDKAPVDSRGRDCLCESLCGACRRAYQIGKSHNDSALVPMLLPSPYGTIRVRKESPTAHPPTLDSLRQEVHTSASIAGPEITQDLEREQIPASQESTPSESSPPPRVAPRPLGQPSECRLCGRSFSHLALACADTLTARGATRLASASTQDHAANNPDTLSTGDVCICRSADIRSEPSGDYTITSRHLKQKDLLGIPWMVAFALRADGWYLRQDIIWSKPNPMPESVTDRCTKAHEYIFMFSKSPRYFYDAAAIRNPASDALIQQVEEGYNGGDTKDYGASGAQSASGTKARIIEGARKRLDKQRGHSRRHAGFNERWDKMSVKEQCALGSNKRSVWTVSTHAFKGAHFATFPPDLIRPCILAGCPAGGTVLDPFGGSGTTGMVAMELGRSAILCELNPDYAELCRKRCDVTPGFAI